MKTNELTALMNDRMLAYCFLARAYRTAPDASFVEALRVSGAGERPDDDPLASFFADLGEASREQVRIDLTADYNRLFLGMSSHPIAPFESVFTSTNGLLMQEARDEVVTVFHSEGFMIDPQFDLPEDHLSLELEFMSLMAARTQKALEGGNQTEAARCITVQRVFLEDHLSRWVPAFCEKFAKQARTKFFRGLAAMTTEQIQIDKTLLAQCKASTI